MINNILILTTAADIGQSSWHKVQDLYKFSFIRNFSELVEFLGKGEFALLIADISLWKTPTTANEYAHIKRIPVLFRNDIGSDDFSVAEELQIYDFFNKDDDIRIVENRILNILSSFNVKWGMDSDIQENELKSKIKLQEEELVRLRESRKNYQSFIEIGLALSIEKNIDRLLEMIVDEARALAHADAGTLYIVDPDQQCLNFQIMQTESMGVRQGGISGNKINLPPVPLYKEGKPNHYNVCSYTALTQGTVNIADVYEADGFDFSGARKYDASTGYLSKSMLVIPMKNHENDTIGVLQLLNSTDECGNIVPFSPDYEDLIGSLASQAAVALTNTQLLHSLRELFDAFIQAIATAIDAKSPYTSGHIRRVVDVTMAIAQAVTDCSETPFNDVHFSSEELDELKLAAWMHDIGKIVTPQYVMDKITKLQTISDKIHIIENRFKRIIAEKKSLFWRNNCSNAGCEKKYTGDETPEDLEWQLNLLEEELEFIKECNRSREFMTDDMYERMLEISEKAFVTGGEKIDYLLPDEIENLCVRKGNLTNKEREVMQYHATMTIKMLSSLPFPRNLSNVALYAGQHHEKLDGSGYPLGVTEKDIPWQSRIMAIADIFEALTAKDRPYKKPMKLSKALAIMENMVKEHHIDKDLYELFIRKRVFSSYAERELDADQIDIK